MSLSLRFLNAQVLRDDGLEPRELSILNGEIAEADGRAIDLTGYWVLPAFVDIHGDGFERHLAPRRGALKDLGQGLMSADAELAASGVGTAVLAQFYSWEGGMRGPDFARRFLAAHRDTALLTDTRLQLRFETHLLDDYAVFEALVAEYDVPYVVFNDHLPHDALAKGKRPPRMTGQALKSGRSPEAHLALLQELHSQSAAVSEALPELAQRLRASGVLLGSHDVESADRVAQSQAMGCAISEFPMAPEAAQSAQTAGQGIVMGAPNVVRGGSHSGQLAAVDLIREGLCDALASDYHYPALKQAAFRLVDDGILSLQDAWHLVSAGPAQLLGLTDRGKLTPGQRADLVILNPETRRIEATLVAGKISYLSGAAASRFLA